MNKHILVFDSGLGGTTVLQEIQHRLPHCSFSYAMDNGAFPYGNKSNAFLMERTTTLFKSLIEISHPDIIVIACNTASTLILDQLRILYQIPFVGVVPAIKPAAALSKTKVICLLATEATIGRDYVKQLKDAFAIDCQVIPVGSQELVEIAEAKILGDPVDAQEIRLALSELLKHPLADQIDTFVLGCTHFPAIKNDLAGIWPREVHWIDSGEAIARRVEQLCKNLPEQKTCCRPTLYLTKPEERVKISRIFKDYGILETRLIKME